MDPLTVRLEIDPGQQPIRGRLLVAGSTDACEFAGWVELVHLLDRARAAADADLGPPGPGRSHEPDRVSRQDGIVP